jgi:cation diffusion facilitator family transporter
VTEIHHEHDHDHSDGHHHEHAHHHEHGGGVLAIIGEALHLPGFTHSHSHTPDTTAYDNDLGIRTVWLALLILGIATVLQIVIYLASGSVALLADTVHNLGDALNSVPLLAALYLARRVASRRYTYGYGRAEDIAGVFIVISIGFSAGYILLESIQKLLNPQPLNNLGWVAAAALIGFAGNELVALMQIRVGRQIGSDAMVADGQHARADGLTSLAVLIGVGGAWLGMPVLDPLVGLVIGVAIVGITFSAAKAVWFRLMDAVDPQYVQTAEAILREHAEIERIDRLQLRWAGHRLRGEFVIAVNDGIDLKQSQALADHLVHHMQHALPNVGDMTVQIASA